LLSGGALRLLEEGTAWARIADCDLWGEFTTEGFTEDSAHLGDRFAVGSAEVVVTQPRLPCYKLNVRFDSSEMVKRFLASGRTGFYLAVTREGRSWARGTSSK